MLHTEKSKLGEFISKGCIVKQAIYFISIFFKINCIPLNHP